MENNILGDHNLNPDQGIFNKYLINNNPKN
jgi:hypothetical protein